MSALNRDKISILDRLAEVGGKAKSVIQGMNKREAQEELEVSRKNWIINGGGDFFVQQRADYSSPVTVTATGYQVDRWKFARVGSDHTVQVKTGVSLPDGTNTTTIYTEIQGTGSFGIFHSIEDYQSLEGNTVTVSFWVRQSCTGTPEWSLYNGAVFLHAGYPANTGTWEKVVWTGEAPTGGATFRFRFFTGAGAASGDYIEFTNVKVEIGDTATPFEVEPYAEVLRKCGILPLAGNHFPERYIDGTAGYDDANDNSSCVLLHKLGQGMGFLLHGGFGFQSWSGDAHFNGVISCIFNTDAVFSSVSRIDDTNKGSVPVSLVTVTYKGASWLALKKTGGSTGTFYTGGCYIDSPTLQERSPVTVADSDVTVTTTHSTL